MVGPTIGYGLGRGSLGGSLVGLGHHMNGAGQSRHPAGCGVVLENSFVHGAIEDLVDIP